MTIGLAAEQYTSELRKKDILLLDSLKRIMKDCRLIITSMLEKMFERSLNASSFLESAGCMKSIVSKPKANLLQQMKSLLHYILSCSHITSNE